MEAAAAEEDATAMDDDAPNVYFDEVTDTDEELTCRTMSLEQRSKTPEYKICMLTSYEIGEASKNDFIKRFMKPRPNKKELITSAQCLQRAEADEHEVCFKTSRGQMNVKLWVKS